MHNYRNGIEEALNTTKFQLDKIHTDIGRTLEKIRFKKSLKHIFFACQFLSHLF